MVGTANKAMDGLSKLGLDVLFCDDIFDAFTKVYGNDGFFDGFLELGFQKLMEMRSDWKWDSVARFVEKSNVTLPGPLD